jgi:hypothetical protein
MGSPTVQTHQEQILQKPWVCRYETHPFLQRNGLKRELSGLATGAADDLEVRLQLLLHARDGACLDVHGACVPRFGFR